MFLILGIVLPFLGSANLSQFANESTIRQVIFSSDCKQSEWSKKNSPIFLRVIEREIVRLCGLRSRL